MTVNLFKWGRKRDLSSTLDDRWGDPSISAPNEGSWNENPVQPSRTEPCPVKQSKARRFVSMICPKGSDSTERETAAGSSVHDPLPHHPLADPRGYDPERIRNRTQKPDASGRVESGPYYRPNIGLDNVAKETIPEDDHPQSQNGSERTPADRIKKTTVETRTQPAADSQKNTLWPKSPPLASTARMRRYSGQSAITNTDRATPSTGSFGSKHTSLTSSTSAASAPPVPSEAHPPLPQIIALHPDQHTGRSATSGRTQKRRGRERAVGPQELVPSYDELWGW